MNFIWATFKLIKTGVVIYAFACTVLQTNQFIDTGGELLGQAQNIVNNFQNLQKLSTLTSQPEQNPGQPK